MFMCMYVCLNQIEVNAHIMGCRERETGWVMVFEINMLHLLYENFWNFVCEKAVCDKFRFESSAIHRHYSTFNINFNVHSRSNEK